MEREKERKNGSCFDSDDVLTIELNAEIDFYYRLMQMIIKVRTHYLTSYCKLDNSNFCLFVCFNKVQRATGDTTNSHRPTDPKLHSLLSFVARGEAWNPSAKFYN